MKHHACLTFLIFLTMAGHKLWSWQPDSSISIVVEWVQCYYYAEAIFLYTMVICYAVWTLYIAWQVLQYYAERWTTPSIHEHSSSLVFAHRIITHELI